MLRCRDLVIFVVTTDRQQTTDKTDCFTLAHVHRAKIWDQTLPTIKYSVIEITQPAQNQEEN